MEKKERDLTINDLKNFTNDLIKLYNNKYPQDRITYIDPVSQLGIFEIGATLARIGGRLGIRLGQSYGIADLAVKIGEIKRKLEESDL